MEKELIKKFRDAEKRTTILQRETVEQEYLDEENVKEIIRVALNELNFKTNGRTRNEQQYNPSAYNTYSIPVDFSIAVSFKDNESQRNRLHQELMNPKIVSIEITIMA